MSAYIVSKAHIDALVQAGLAAGRRYNSALSWRGGQLDHMTADRVGAMLWKENVASVRYRYPDVGPDLADAPGPIGLTPFDINGYTFPIMSARRLKPVAVLKAISCYEYQSCEHPEWESSQARAFCEALRTETISMLPGYEEAPWEVTA